MSEEKSTYDQKYLDEKFALLLNEMTEMKTLIVSNNKAVNKRMNKLDDKVAELTTQDKLLTKEVHTISLWQENIEKRVDQNNFFSVKGVIFVITIFAIVMTAFLINGVDLLQNAI